MKFTSIFFFISACLLQAESQTVLPSNIPTAVIDEFEKKFPDAGNIRWTQEMPGFLEAEFLGAKGLMNVTYSTTGTWFETDYNIKRDSLPAACTEYISTNFPESKIFHSGVSESSIHGLRYEVDIRSDGKKWELTFDATGKFIMKGQAE